MLAAAVHVPRCMLRACMCLLEVSANPPTTSASALTTLPAVKSSNVLLTATGSAKLADVGVSRMQTRTYLSETIGVVGTWAWIAPEVLMGCRCTLSVDLYSFGVLLWEIATGERPVRGQLRMPVVPEEAPQELVDVMQDCMNLEATARPTAHQLLQRLQELAHGRNGD
jgi:serine/threonine protein kinase